MPWWPFGGKKCPKCGEKLVAGHKCPVQGRNLREPGDRRQPEGDDGSSGTVSFVVGAVTGDPLLATLAGGDLPMALVGSAIHGSDDKFDGFGGGESGGGGASSGDIGSPDTDSSDPGGSDSGCGDFDCGGSDCGGGFD